MSSISLLHPGVLHMGLQKNLTEAGYTQIQRRWSRIAIALLGTVVGATVVALREQTIPQNLKETIFNYEY